MSFLLFALCHSLTLAQAPAGTPLHIRLTSPVGTWASKKGSPVRAVLIAPVTVDGDTVLPMGTIVSGKVSSVKRVGFGIIHETASLDLTFDRLTLPGGSSLPFSGMVTEVDNARERVDRAGVVHGVRATSSLCYRASGYIQVALEWEIHAEIAEWIFRALLVQLPEPEIYYPAGVEMTLRLNSPLAVREADPPPPEPALSPQERASLEDLADGLPDRSYSLSNRPADLVNVLFIGSRDELATAFRSAGWAEPHPTDLRSRIRDIRAVAELAGYRRAPMSELYVNDLQPDMSWEKGLNDLSKRHHIRIWHQPERWHGQDVWIGAATRDVDFAYFRPGQAMTHRVAKNVDAERDKVADDLVFTSCVSSTDWLDRASVPHLTRNSTGDLMSTDGRMAVLKLGNCNAPRFAAVPDETPLPAHGGRMQRFARREILAFRSDMIRGNVYYRAYEGSRMVITALVRRHRRRVERTTPEPDPAPAVARNVKTRPAS